MEVGRFLRNDLYEHMQNEKLDIETGGILRILFREKQFVETLVLGIRYLLPVKSSSHVNIK